MRRSLLSFLNLLSLASAAIETGGEREKQRNLIIGGDDADFGRYPYNVALVDELGTLVCGGVLIAPDVVITISQCEGAISAQIGRYNMEEATEPFEDIRVDSQFQHPFNTGNGAYEFLLLKLSNPSSSKYIKINEDPNLPVGGMLGEYFLGEKRANK
jgi:secreted trypsin-like serine protease